MRAPITAASLLLGSLLAPPAGGYPHGPLRPVDSVLSGPTDASLAALQYNPASLRLLRGVHFEVHGGTLAHLGSYTRSAQLPGGFSGAGGQAGEAAATPIRWAAPTYFIGGSWDLGSESVTLGAAVYAPYSDQTQYPDDDETALRRLPTRYQAVTSQTYSLWGSVAAALRVTSWLQLGGGFQFAWTRDRLHVLRDPDPRLADGLSCGDPARCEQWEGRQDLRLDVGGWGYGFTAGALFVLEDQRLWLSASYVSPLFTSEGSQVVLDGFPPEGSAACQATAPEGWRGAQVQSPRLGLVCSGGAQLVLSYPHMVYLSARKRLDDPSGRTSGLEVGGWARLTIPPRSDEELRLERRPFVPLGLPTMQRLPMGQQTAVAIEANVRELFSALQLGQALLYESARTSPEAVSPQNLDAHKLDASATARIRLTVRQARSLWLIGTVGATFYLFSGGAGDGFQPGLADRCRQAGYDARAGACQLVQDGWAQPSAAGSYLLTVLHGGAALEANL